MLTWIRSFTQSFDVGAVSIVPVLPMRQLRRGEMKSLTEDDTAGKWGDVMGFEPRQSGPRMNTVGWWLSAQRGVGRLWLPAARLAPPRWLRPIRPPPRPAPELWVARVEEAGGL